MNREVAINAAIGGMAALFMDKHGGRNIHVTDEFPELHTLKRTYLGAFSWANKTDRWTFKRYVTEILGLPFSPADIAREYLTWRYGLQKRRTSTQAYQDCFVPKHKPPPIFAAPFEGELVYIDLKSAYWNIVKTVGWDADYAPNRYIGVRSNNHDFPFPENKLARNILVSTGLPSRVQVWTGKKLTSIRAKNPLYNGILWCLVQDVMHGIASDMVNAGAVYVHTDGYILPSNLTVRAFDIADSWGLPVGVKYYGKGSVLGAGNYWIEGKPLKKPKPSQYHVTDNLETCSNVDWLRGWFYRNQSLRDDPY